MSEHSFSWSLFEQAPLVGIIRNVSFEDVKRILPIYREAGLTTVEITMNTPGAADMIAYALEEEGEGLNIGAGTVCTKDDLNDALDAGAQFIVTPVISKKVIKSCVKKGIPVFPGAFTPSEIYNAWTMGASMVKIYPATSLGPEYIKDLKAPMNQLKLLPTGGVSLENMSDFLKAGANGLGIGSQLFDKKIIQEKDWAGLKAHFSRFVQKLSI
ncbi:bifunctional 4-hydroxy-2-oxoglutarate aldolase/2-dehydro-3-deoxy-phosphogluconate aldolase [Dyadobacter sandarakinus]|uniref:Bifunctional 4-hydroxy-2-oxoglutarate aldolase/2-dehydro-3-deoxy-phosphogluconate aldolase n=1 Tax=Dyadobacter sandarakinus TaxID=2747268 RepID=A0ABX7I0I3_9BACT|nr:bifunctional 4-hydroxy-2-oxoglutarate aldolase/2-dehydro-3-deoxy-phosphogluconate aldolase [Dyadobacter sandarakinus]QRQ99535.1 bifunctional 4-hydroxy-2-oxoglutarate aldolase/2-dehydro-3-deoxy-phosphogluconate aldolase [Dyadobacter sandarakinus]